LLDVFVFDHVEKLLKRAKTDKKLDRLLRSEKVVFFLQYFLIIFSFISLLGLDTNGHAHRPNSREYLDNIRIVDQGIEKIEKLMNDFYKDDKTAFIMTADHGMSDIGTLDGLKYR
jgi:phosphatidylinositol glycan class N